MEDALSMVENTPPPPSPSFSIYSVFDGHGGHACSTYAAKALPGVLLHALGKLGPPQDVAPVPETAAASPMSPTNKAAEVSRQANRVTLGAATDGGPGCVCGIWWCRSTARQWRPPCSTRCRRCDTKRRTAGPSLLGRHDLSDWLLVVGVWVQVDRSFLQEKMAEAEAKGEEEMNFSGTTAMVSLFDGRSRLLVASLGDCRAVLSRRGTAVVISAPEHKATRKDEAARIIKRGVSRRRPPRKRRRAGRGTGGA